MIQFILIVSCIPGCTSCATTTAVDDGEARSHYITMPRCGRREPRWRTTASLYALGLSHLFIPQSRVIHRRYSTRRCKGDSLLLQLVRTIRSDSSWPFREVTCNCLMVSRHIWWPLAHTCMYGFNLRSHMGNAMNLPVAGAQLQYNM